MGKTCSVMLKIAGTILEFMEAVMYKALNMLAALAFGAAAASSDAKDDAQLAEMNYLTEFTNKTGAHPASEPIIASDGNYYGALPQLAHNGNGSLYKLTPDGTLTVLHVFKMTDGAHPVGPLVQATDGALYGATALGGHQKDCGTIFKLTLDGSFNTIHTFSCGHGGETPSGGLIQATNGLLYGVTETGGLKNQGAVYSISASGAYTLIGSFLGKTGMAPQGELVQANDGRLFGITTHGGHNEAGTIFSITLGGEIVTQHNFFSSDHPSGLTYSPKTDTFYGFADKVIIYALYRGKRNDVALLPYPAVGNLTLNPDEDTLYGYCESNDSDCIFMTSLTGATSLFADGLIGVGAGRPVLDPSGDVLGATQSGGKKDDGTIFITHQ
jgi:uncharacterized repeat protein (TIGR03803 family)